MSKLLRIALWSFIGGALFLAVYVAQPLLVCLVGGLVVALVGVGLAAPSPVPVKSGLLAGLIGVVINLIYAAERPGIAVLSALAVGLGAGLIAAQRRQRDTPREGAIQGGLAGLIAGAFTVLALMLVAFVVAPAAGINAAEFAENLYEKVPFARELGFGSDVAILGTLSGVVLLLAGLMGALAGAARGISADYGRFVTYGVILLPLLLLPLIDRAGSLQLLDPIIKVYVFIVLALGLNIVVGYAGLLDLGYAAFFAIGAYTAAMLSSPHFNLSWSFWLVIWIAAGVAALAGIILGSPTLPLRGDYLAIVTLGFGEIVPIAVKNLGGGGSGTLTLKFLNYPILNQVDLTGGTKGIGPINPPLLPGIAVFTPANKIPWYYLVLVIMGLTLFLINRLRGSRQGRAWTALREDELAADAMGINVVRTKLMAFAMGATFSGFAGAFYGAFIGSIFPSSFEFSVSIILLCMVILGGLGNMAGVIIGGLIIMGTDVMLLPEAASLIKDIVETRTGSSFIATYRDPSQQRLLLFGLVLVVMMLVRPEGLVPNARRRAEFHEHDDTVIKQANSDLYDAERDSQLAGK